MISCSCPPLIGTTQICGVRVSASRSTSTALNSTHLPAGGTCGEPTRLSFIMSSNVNGRLDCENEGMLTRNTIRAKPNRRMQASAKPLSVNHALFRDKDGDHTAGSWLLAVRLPTLTLNLAVV